MRFEHRLHANIGERLVRTVLGDFEILHLSASINIKSKSQRADGNQVTLLIYKDIPPTKYARDFDGFYAWVHPGSKGWTADGSDWGEDYLQGFYKSVKSGYPDKLVVGTIWPGFDDSKASWGLNRRIDRRCGKTFEDTLHVFRQHNDPSRPMPFLLIATWNDYEEGTQIEDGVAHCEQRQQNRAAAGGSR